jgi:uncharacterized lipoprotein YbaY
MMCAPEISGTFDLVPGPASERLDVHVRLEDTTMLDAPSIVIAEARYSLLPDSTLPADFSLSVPDSKLDARRQYTLSARGWYPRKPEVSAFGTTQSYPWSADANSVQRLELHRFDRN